MHVWTDNLFWGFKSVWSCMFLLYMAYTTVFILCTFYLLFLQNAHTRTISLCYNYVPTPTCTLCSTCLTIDCVHVPCVYRTCLFNLPWYYYALLSVLLQYMYPVYIVHVYLTYPGIITLCFQFCYSTCTLCIPYMFI